MTWPPLDSLLPTPRDDEPRSLRENLMDEVRDHLQSAYLGELLKTPDPVQAKKNVLARFGNPAKIVRQLWFQAMQEKIMSQRILVGTCAVLALASLAGVGMMWNLNRNHQAAMLQSRRELIDSLEQNQKSNLQLLQTFISEQKNLTTKADPEWCPVKIRCSLGKKGGPPAKGFVVSFHRRVAGTPPDTTNLVVPEDGLVDMGLLQFGKYTLTIRSPEGESPNYFSTGDLEILPRLPQTPLYGEYVCPDGLPAEVSVKPQVVWPEPLRDKHLWMLCTFSSDWKLEGRAWEFLSYPNPAHPWKNPQFHSPEGGEFQGGGGAGGLGGGGFGGGGGGFGLMDFNRNGIGYASLEDNLDQNIRPTLSGSARWKCLINDRGEVWDLGLWTFDGPEIALGEEYLAGFSFPKFRDPQDSLGGGVYGQIIRLFNEPTSGAAEVKWPAGELRLASIAVYLAPHTEYGLENSEPIEGTEVKRLLIKPITAQDLLGTFPIQSVDDLGGLPADHPLCQFRGLPGQENSLPISLQESWVTIIQQTEQKRKEFHKALELTQEEAVRNRFQRYDAGIDDKPTVQDPVPLDKPKSE